MKRGQCHAVSGNGIALVVCAGILIFGIRLLTRSYGHSSWLGFFITVVSGIGTGIILFPTLSQEPSAPGLGENNPLGYNHLESIRTRWMRIVILFFGLLCATLAARRFWLPDEYRDRWVTFVWWFGAILFCAAASLWKDQNHAPFRPSRCWAIIEHRRFDVLAGLFFVVLAGVARFIRLERFPSVLGYDESEFLVVARSFRTGGVVDPFGTGFLMNPSMYMALEGWVSRPFDDGVAGYRLFSALIGSATVIVIWILGTRLLGSTIGWVAAGILAILPIHLAFSRSGLNNISESFTLACALLLLDLGLRGSAWRGWAYAMGAVLGFGLFGYYSARIFPIVIVLAMLASVLVERRSELLRRSVGMMWWATVGFLTAGLPMLVNYVRDPHTFFGRMQDVVTATTADGGLSQIVALVSSAVRRAPTGLLYPWNGPAEPSFYMADPPYLGWIVTILMTLGVVLWLFQISYRLIWKGRMTTGRPETIVVASILGCIAIGTTVPIWSHRYLQLAPIASLAAATGLVCLVRYVGAKLSIHDVRPHLLIFTIAIGIYHAGLFYNENQQIQNYGSLTNTLEFDLSWRLDQSPDVKQVYLVGTRPVGMTALGRFLLPTPPSIESAPMYVEGNPDAPSPDSHQTIIWGPLRPVSQLCSHLSGTSDNDLLVARDHSGNVLYYAVNSPTQGSLSTDVSPAGSVLEELSVSELCGSS